MVGPVLNDVVTTVGLLLMPIGIALVGISEIAKLFKNNMNWIDVNERLPEQSDTVLVADDNMIEPSLAFHDNGVWYDINSGGVWSAVHGSCGITHWQPLPSMPEEQR